MHPFLVTHAKDFAWILSRVSQNYKIVFSVLIFLVAITIGVIAPWLGINYIL